MNLVQLQLWLARFAFLILVVTLLWTLGEIALSGNRKSDLMKLTEILLSWQVIAGVFALSNARYIFKALGVDLE